MVDWLSQFKVIGLRLVTPSSPIISLSKSLLRRQQPLLDIQINSEEDLETMPCFLDFQAICEFPNKST